jgi:hypothetical protein
MFGGFSHSVIGASHETTGLVCQDHSAFEVNEHYSIAVSADGHGSKKYFRSNFGSQFAVEAALETIRHFYAEPEHFEQNFPQNHKLILKNIEKQMIVNWNARVQRHLEENPVKYAEKSKFSQAEFEKIAPESYYGTTLICAVMGKGFEFGIQIGDGSLVAIFEDGVPVMPMVYDESAPANMTASMCNSNAAGMFNSFYIEDKRAIAMFASTDGLYTSFSNEEEFLDYHLIITSQLDQLDKVDRSVRKNLEKRSHFGTEDDISLSCICDLDFLQEKAPELRATVADNKAHAAERKAQRLAALKNKD